NAATDDDSQERLEPGYSACGQIGKSPCQNARQGYDVGDDLVLEIDSRQGNKHSQQGSRHDGVRGGAEPPGGCREEGGGDGLDQRITPGDSGAASAAACPQDEERQDRDVVVPRDHCPATWAGRARTPDAAALGNTGDDD